MYRVSSMENQKIKSFTDLDAWKEAHKLVLLIYRHTKSFPEEEKFGLTNQIRRATVSITSNIAEGFGRSTQKDKINFYVMAKSSLFEVQSQLMIAKDLGYITKDVFSGIADVSVVVSRLLAGLSKSAASWK